MDIISRLKRFMEKYQMGSSQFADYAGISRPTLSQLLNGRNKKISDELISKIHAAFPHLSILWLLFGEGDMELSPNNETLEPQISEKELESSTQNLDNKTINEPTDFFGAMSVNNSEKISGESFTFPESESAIEKKYSDHLRLRKSSLADKENNSTTPAVDEVKENGQEKLLSDLFPESNSGKRIKNIVVFYDDATFETFLPS